MFIAVFALLFFKQAAFSSELDLSVTVPSKATDFELTVNADVSAPVPQYETVTYEITYGSNLDYADNLEIQAEWSLGTIEGESTPAVDIAEYVIGSASTAYNSTPAVIDLVNRKIIWNISSFPANTTNQTVSFKLKTTANYTGSKQVAFTISSRLTNDDMTTSDETVTNYYEYDLSITPSPTPSPTSAPTSTPIITPTPTLTPTPGATAVTSSTTPTPTISPTPTPIIPKTPVIEDLIIRSLSSNNAVVSVTTDQATTAKFYYGTSLKSLTNTINSLTLTKEHELNLEDLIEETTYYFKVNVTNANLKTSFSDIFTFKTPPISIAPEVNNTSVIITSNNNVLASPSIEGITQKQPNASIVIPKDTIYEFKFSLKKYESIKEIKAVLKNKNVLGISSFIREADASVVLTNITEIEPGIFIGKLKSPKEPGNYEVIVRIIDVNGNINEQKIADVRVSSPLSVFNKNNKPIEGARLLLYLYNARLGEFEPISSENIPIKNPSFSNAKGEFNVVLPNGIYKAEVIAIGYEKNTQNFRINFQGGNDYPRILLKSQGFSVLNLIEYYWAALNDFISLTANYVSQVTVSVRFFELISILIIITSILLSWLSISLRAHIPIVFLFWHPIVEIKDRFTKHKLQRYYYGIVTETNGFAQGKAMVYLINADKNIILSKTMTNHLGEFFLKRVPAKHYKILVAKKGFEIKPFFEYSSESLETNQKLVLEINRLEEQKHIIITVIERTFDRIAELSFSTLLVISLVFELLLTFEVGLEKVAPFILISLFNIYLWGFYLRKDRIKN